MMARLASVVPDDVLHVRTADVWVWYLLKRPTASNVAAFLVCFWHESEMLTASRIVRVRGQSGKHVLVLSSSQFDPDVGPAVRCKRFVDLVASGLASMYPVSS
jgi:hypothetical protein